jgi:hypothetical protein
VIALTNRYQKKPKKVTYSKKSYIFKKKKKALAQTFRSHLYHPSYKILTKSPLFSRKITVAEKRDDIFIIKPRKLKLWLEKKEINDIPWTFFHNLRKKATLAITKTNSDFYFVQTSSESFHIPGLEFLLLVDKYSFIGSQT